jgi:hypothetical protein
VGRKEGEIPRLSLLFFNILKVSCSHVQSNSVT